MLLGASNLTRAFPTVVSAALSSFERPLSILAAMGFGRSYGQESRFFLKKNSGIFQSKIWDVLKHNSQTSTTAFVTDIGNDLAYEVPVETVVEWIETCLDRLDSIASCVVLSDLPMSSLRDVGEARYRLFRTVLFPSCRLTWTEMLTRAERLSERLHLLSESRNIPIFVDENEWYGFDPIHPRVSAYSAIWRELFALAGAKLDENPAQENHRLLSWYIRDLRPESWSMFSISRHAQQPQGRLHDGTTISLY